MQPFLNRKEREIYIDLKASLSGVRVGRNVNIYE